MSRIAILCPGRGSYGKQTRSSLDPTHRYVARAEALRATYGLPSLLELDRDADWSNDVQLRADNVSPLIWLVNMIDADAAMREHEAVAIAGNSMGWYTALAVAGALSFEDGFRLVQEMALLQMDGPDGGQLLYPLVDEEWRWSETNERHVRAAVAAAPDEAFESIRLGGYAVLAGSEKGISSLQESLPTVLMGTASYPLRLAQHGPYHTPLVEPVARQARAQLTSLTWNKPRIPLIDGNGRRHSPWSADPAELRDYTLGAQVTTPFDFTCCIRIALREFAPARLCLPGPGNRLGSICAQAAILEGWRGLRSRAGFEAMQKSDQPLVWSMRR